MPVFVNQQGIAVIEQACKNQQNHPNRFAPSIEYERENCQEGIAVSRVVPDEVQDQTSRKEQVQEE
jgi:hypothetical protein